MSNNPENNSSQSSRQVLYTSSQKLSPEPRINYIDHHFLVPEGVSKVGIQLSFFKKN